MRRWAAAAATALLLALLLAPGAAAHANLGSSDPRAGARLDAVPSLVTVTLTEAVDPAGTSLTVTDSAGRRVDQGDLKVGGGPNPTLQVHLQPNLPAGAYTIHWQALSVTDGHHTGGTVGFAVGAFTPPGSTAHGAGHLDVPSALARALAYAGFSLAFGGAALLAWLRRPAGGGLERSAIAWGATLHLAGTLLLVQLTVSESGVRWGQLGGSAVGRVLLTRLLVGGGAWAMALLAVARPTRTGPWAAVLLLLAAGLGSARLGHGSGDGPATVALDLLHLVATSTWVGSLALLLLALRRAQRDGADPAALRALGIRYGTLALACVVILWATGAIVGLAILGRDAVLHPAATLRTPYGAFLLGKMALAALMVAIAAVNRYVFLEDPTQHGWTGRIQGAARRASGGRVRPLTLRDGGLRSAIAVEAALGAAVLVLAGLLTAVSPPADATPPPLTLAQQGDVYLVRMDVDPDPRLGGSSALTFTIEEAATGKRLETNTCGGPSCLQAEVAYAGLGDAEAHAVYASGGTWSVRDLVWTRAGPATVRLSVSSAEVFHDEVAFSLTVAP